MMRFALVHEHESDGGKRRCALRPSPVRRAVDAEPSDAAKSRVVRSRSGESEPGNAAKGERGASRNGAVQC
jgi:hypothetical protein